KSIEYILFDFWDEIELKDEFTKIINPIVEEKRKLKPWDLVHEVHQVDKPWSLIYQNGRGNH
ncbi:MAG: hypothetical protein UHG91_07165, partial [Succinivibrionaceae bacterium]|nr:hypothetical protein [Succinivibrionaceae bacterium]